MTATGSADLRVDVYSDVVCPWCFIGTRRMQEAVDSIGGSVTVRHHPFVLQPDASEEGLDLHAMLRARYGTDPASIFARVESAGRESGISLDLSKQPMTYSTVKAHTLLRHAEEKGTQSELLDAMFRAYFLDARNIADTGVLAEVAAGHGFTADEVRRILSNEAEIARTESEVESARRAGVHGVPLFIINESIVLEGAQPVQAMREVFDRARAA